MKSSSNISKTWQSQIGVCQGRLVPPYNGELQCFPKDLWDKEFHLATSLGLSFIELLAERNFNPENPLWSDAGIAKILHEGKAAGLKFYSACNDFVIDHSILDDKSSLESAKKILKPMKALGCSIYVIPLFEKSDINAENYLKFVPFLSQLADAAQEVGVKLSLETLLDNKTLLDLIKKIDRKNVGVCFDTGNRASIGCKLGPEIQELGSSINHVHLKDKNPSRENVIPGTGLVNFLEVFRALANINYLGFFSFETTRGVDPLRTMKNNLQLIHFFMTEADEEMQNRRQNS